MEEADSRAAVYCTTVSETKAESVSNRTVLKLTPFITAVTITGNTVPRSENASRTNAAVVHAQDLELFFDAD